MNSLRNIVVFLSFILFGTSSLNAQPVCTAADIAGTWRVFTVTGSPFFQRFGRGTLVFSPTGALNTRLSSLLVSNRILGDFVSGQMRVSSTCKTTGRFVTARAIVIRMLDGRLDSNKTVISGVYRTSEGDLGLVNLIR